MKAQDLAPAAPRPVLVGLMRAEDRAAVLANIVDNRPDLSVAGVVVDEGAIFDRMAAEQMLGDIASSARFARRR